MKFTRAFLAEPGRFELSQVEENVSGDEVLLKITTCGLCNWELNFWLGHLNFYGYPHPLGHEWAGTVVEAGPDVKNLQVGDNVTGLVLGFGGFAEYKVVSEMRCCKLDDGINPKYALGEPLKCVITVIRCAAPEVGDNGVVLGCGPMGLWTIQALAGNTLASLIAIDLDEERLKLAQRYGATHTINAKDEDIVERLRDITQGRMTDFVIEGTGVPALLNSSQQYLKTTGRGKLIVMSSHEESCKEFDFREAVKRSLQIIIAHRGFSVDEMDDFRRAVGFINSNTFRIEELVSHEFRLADIQKAFETLEHKPSNYLKGIVAP